VIAGIKAAMQSITELADFQKATASGSVRRCVLQLDERAHLDSAASHRLRLLCVADTTLTVSPPLQTVVHFWAAWCEPCKFLDQVLGQLAADAPGVAAVRVEAEEAADISERYNVSVVPYFLFLRDGQLVDSLEGADAAALTTKFNALAGTAASGGSIAAAQPAALQPARAPSYVEPAVGGNLQERLKQLVSQKPVMLFMKVRGWLGGWEGAAWVMVGCLALAGGLPGVWVTAWSWLLVRAPAARALLMHACIVHHWLFNLAACVDDENGGNARGPAASSAACGTGSCLQEDNTATLSSLF
jgi:thiol-disulfide isomerase/thioredoxin